MGRRRKAWASGRTARWYEYRDGERVHRSRTFATRSTAREWVRQYNARLDLRQIGQVAPIALRDAAAEFLRSCAGLADDTRIHHAGALGELGTVTGPAAVVSEIRQQHVDDVLRAKPNKATRARVRGSLVRFFNWAMREGYAGHNPASATARAKRGDLRRSRPNVSEEQLEAVLAAVDTADRYVAVLVALTTGLDRKVIERLTPEQVDTESRCFRVVRRKTGEPVTPPIHFALVPWLSQRLHQTLPGQRMFRGLSRQRGEVDWWHRVRKAAELPTLLFRDLRALASSRPQRLVGMPLADARQLLGHASVTTTADHYTAPDPHVLQRFDQLPLPGRQRLEELTRE